MARLYSDENVDRRVVEELRRLGDDMLTAFAAGLANQRIPDPDVLAFATAQGRTLVTYNRRHFKHLHRSGRKHHGIIACSDDPDVIALAQRIHAAIAGIPNLDDQFISIDRAPQP